MFNLPEGLIILTLIINIVLMITFLSILVVNRSLIKKLEEQSNMIFYIIKKIRSIDNSLFEESQTISEINENMYLLSNNVDSYILSENKKSKTKVFPTPDVAKMITETIHEQISTELTMLQDVRIVSRDVVNRIILNVTRTYPQIDPEYISRKCLAIIKSLPTSKGR